MTVPESGTRPTQPHRKDFDFLASKKLAGAVPSFLPEYNVDAGLWQPNQNAGCDLFTPPTPPMPFGCTNYTGCDLCADQDGRLYDPMILEAVTHANENRGAEMRVALKAVTQTIPGHPAYFRVSPAGKIDAFDAVRLAMLSTSTEKRGVAIGSPFWLQWGAVKKNGVLPMPDFDLKNASWHAWAVKGWKIINGEPYLVCKMWQGREYGDNGFVYVSRPVFNATMAVWGAVAFTIDKLLPDEELQTLGISAYVREIVAYVRFLFNIA